MHIAIIMDGNRRWAKKNGWKKILGHKTGMDVLEEVLDWCPKYNIDVFTIYALSTENLKRDNEELNNLFDLIKEFAQKKDRFKKDNIQVKIMGSIGDIRKDSAESLKILEEFTKNCDGLKFQICVAYGGRDEIVRSVKNLIKNKEDITEESISKNLDSSLEPDLIIRTGGHKRLSNFLMWQSAYSDFLFLDKMWPEFEEKDLKDAVEYLKKEQKNFGK